MRNFFCNWLERLIISEVIEEKVVFKPDDGGELV